MISSLALSAVKGLILMRGKCEVKGTAFVFLRKDGAPLWLGNGGHVGWAFELETAEFYCGSTENLSGGFSVKKGEDNGWWGAVCRTEAEVVEAMKIRNYDGFKFSTVREANPSAAKEVADDSRDRGYTGLGNNCLDHVWDILNAYGVADLPWTKTHPSPNDWFSVFNGEYRNI